MHTISTLQYVSLGLFLIGKLQGMLTVVILFGSDSRFSLWMSFTAYVILILVSVIVALCDKYRRQKTILAV